MHWQQKRCCKRGVQDLHGLTMKMRDLEAYLERTWLLGHWHVFFPLQLLVPVTSVSTMFSTYDYILIVQIVLKTIYIDIDSIYMHIHSIFIYSMYNIVQYILHYISICISTPFTHVYMCVSYLFIDDSLSCVICRPSLNLFCPYWYHGISHPIFAASGGNTYFVGEKKTLSTKVPDRSFMAKNRWHQNLVVVTQIFFIFKHYLGKISHLTYIFQMGWNHQPAKLGDAFL